MELIRRSSAVAVAAALVLVAAACSGGGDRNDLLFATEDAPSAVGTLLVSPAQHATPVAASGSHATCSKPRPHAAGDSNETLTSGGAARTYILHVPPSYDGSREVPLVLNFHGFGSGARQQAIYSQLPAKGDAEGFVVVTPNGTGTPQRWNYPGLPGADDVGFVRDLLDRVEADLCIDPGWVFATGMSNGAAFSSFVACAMPDRIRAIAPVAATTLPRTCPEGASVPIISFRGTADMCVPFEGGTSACGQRFPVVGAEDAMAQWAAHDGCGAEPSRQQLTEHVRAVAYSECADGAAAILYVVEGGGHAWPGSLDVARLGANTHEVNATDEIWQFFAAQASQER